MTETPITAAIRAAPPGLHGADEYWGLAWAALEWLERNVRPEWSTLETGSGASTIVFAAAGANARGGDARRGRGGAHPRRGAPSSASTRAASRFRIGPSHEVLARWEPRPLDLVLVDGAHGFPYPILDWWHVAPHVRVGGTVLLDDAYLPAVAAIVDFARASDAWRVEEAP